MSVHLDIGFQTFGHTSTNTWILKAVQDEPCNFEIPHFDFENSVIAKLIVSKCAMSIFEFSELFAA